MKSTIDGVGWQPVARGEGKRWSRLRSGGLLMDAADVHERECAFGVRDIWSRRRSRPAGLGHGSGLRSVLNGHGKLSIM